MIITREIPSPLHGILQRAKTLPPVDAAVVEPYDDHVVSAAFSAAREGLIRPVLVGDAPEICALLRRMQHIGVDLHVVNAPPGTESQTAVRLAAGAKVKMLIKGCVHSDVLLHDILAESALRSRERLSHVVVTELPGRATPLLLSDGAVTIAPSLEHKAQIVQNAIDLARRLGIDSPRVAVLAAVETVSATMGATVDAAALAEMARRGQIEGGIVDGPLALDDAVDAHAAAAKGLQSPVAGQADILISPDLEAGNILYKAFDALVGARFAAVVTGASVPIVFTSRGDSVESRVLSSALARLLIED